MTVFGYVKDYMYASDGTLLIRVRIPVIHGPWNESDLVNKSHTISRRSYVRDADLPYYQSVLLPHLPAEGEVVMLHEINDNEFAVIGLTGGSYYTGTTNI